MFVCGEEKISHTLYMQIELMLASYFPFSHGIRWQFQVVQNYQLLCIITDGFMRKLLYSASFNANVCINFVFNMWMLRGIQISNNKKAQDFTPRPVSMATSNRYFRASELLNHRNELELFSFAIEIKVSKPALSNKHNKRFPVDFSRPFFRKNWIMSVRRNSTLNARCFRFFGLYWGAKILAWPIYSHTHFTTEQTTNCNCRTFSFEMCFVDT